MIYSYNIMAASSIEREGDFDHNIHDIRASRWRNFARRAYLCYLWILLSIVNGSQCPGSSTARTSCTIAKYAPFPSIYIFGCKCVPILAHPVIFLFLDDGINFLSINKIRTETA
ncbi:hypothetical protein D1007_17874 [Hordeum vulgare]|nr:hypothetical protein D1007_17874 [Hordeum vulgare]